MEFNHTSVLLNETIDNLNISGPSYGCTQQLLQYA